MGCTGSRIQEEPDLNSVWDRYERGEVLGKGGYGEVLVVQRKKDKTEFAMKLMKKTSNDPTIEATFNTESTIMKELDHKNVIKFEASYEDDENYYLVSELCAGGELFDHIVENHHFSEKIAASILRDALLGLKHCHQNNIVHLDLKPENLVLKSEDPDSDIVIIDFGCARKLEAGKTYNDRVGTPYYVSPEMLDSKLQKTGDILKACDMWSLGVIAYVMVTGRPPFGGTDNSRIYARIKRGEYKYPSSLKLSADLKDLIAKLLTKNPVARLTVDEALQHPWVQGKDASTAPLDSSVRDALRHFQNHNKLKKAIAHMLVKNMTKKDELELKKKFQELDKDNSGTLETTEVVKFLKGFGYNEDQAVKNAPEFIKDVDVDHDGVISENEFRTVAVRGQLSTNESKIRETFQQLDANHDGYLTVSEISEFLKMHPGDEIKDMFKEVDANNDGKITYDEFMKAMVNS